MKNFRDYLSESEQAAHEPVAGDTFAINIREECLIESFVIESRHDGVVIAADEGMMRLLESYGYTFEENCMECGMSESDCGCDHEQVDEIAPVLGAIARAAIPMAVSAAMSDDDETNENQNPGEYDQEGDMAKDELYTMIRSARKLIGMLDNNDNMPEWTQKKITKATDYADTAADYISSQKERGVMEDNSEPNPVARAVLHRIMMQHTGILATHGPERVMDAVDELADRVNIGPDDEIGTSDVSGWVRDVIRMLAELPDEPMDVGDALDEQDTAADPESQKFGKYIKKYFGQIYDYGDDGLEYLDNNAPFWAMLFDKHNGDIDYIIAMEPADVLKKAALELKAVAGDLKYELDEQDVAQGSESELDNILSHYAKEVEHFRQGGDLDYDLESALWEYHFNRGDIRNYNADATEYITQQLADELGLTEAEYQGRKVPLGKPMAGDVKKSKVYVKNPQGNVVKVNFGQKGMKIKKSIPGRRKNFRARHNCDNPGPRHKARYWSCRAW